MRVVPLVSPFVPICVFLHREELGAYQFLELGDLHGRCGQLGDVKRRRLVVVVGEAMGRIVLTAFQAKVLCKLIHLLQEEQNLRMILIKCRFHKVRAFPDWVELRFLISQFLV